MQCPSLHFPPVQEPDFNSRVFLKKRRRKIFRTQVVRHYPPNTTQEHIKCTKHVKTLLPCTVFRYLRCIPVPMSVRIPERTISTAISQPPSEFSPVPTFFFYWLFLRQLLLRHNNTAVSFISVLVWGTPTLQPKPAMSLRAAILIGIPAFAVRRRAANLRSY